MDLEDTKKQGFTFVNLEEMTSDQRESFGEKDVTLYQVHLIEPGLKGWTYFVGVEQEKHLKGFLESYLIQKFPGIFHEEGNQFSSNTYNFKKRGVKVEFTQDSFAPLDVIEEDFEGGRCLVNLIIKKKIKEENNNGRKNG